MLKTSPIYTLLAHMTVKMEKAHSPLTEIHKFRRECMEIGKWIRQGILHEDVDVQVSVGPMVSFLSSSLLADPAKFRGEPPLRSTGWKLGCPDVVARDGI